MPAFPNPSKVASKAAAFQMLVAVALECEYFNYCVDLTLEEIASGKTIETMTRDSWFHDIYMVEDGVDPILESIDNAPNNNWWNDTHMVEDGVDPILETIDDVMDDYNYVGSHHHY